MSLRFHSPSNGLEKRLKPHTAGFIAAMRNGQSLSRLGSLSSLPYRKVYVRTVRFAQHCTRRRESDCQQGKVPCIDRD